MESCPSEAIHKQCFPQFHVETGVALILALFIGFLLRCMGNFSLEAAEPVLTQNISETYRTTCDETFKIASRAKKNANFILSFMNF
jgi:hypothetical protein